MNQLGTYNSEKNRGLLHSEGWQARMATLQARFDTYNKVATKARIMGANPGLNEEDYDFLAAGGDPAELKVRS
jgi:hypothetical protein